MEIKRSPRTKNAVLVKLIGPKFHVSLKKGIAVIRLRMLFIVFVLTFCLEKHPSCLLSVGKDLAPKNLIDKKFERPSRPNFAQIFHLLNYKLTKFLAFHLSP